MTSKLGLAIAIAAEAFKDKVDKGGQPYILHCLRVMNAIKIGDDDVKCAAVLHDIIEDTHFTFGGLIDLKFSHRTCSLVSILTHEPNMEYKDYIKKIAIFPDAREIKMADLEDNMNMARLKTITEIDWWRLLKYNKAYNYLSNY